MRLGIFGGTFDPVHLGHLIIAETACTELQLETVLFVLAPNPPHKNSEQLTDVSHRLAMLQLALAGNPRFTISTMELQRPGPSYTVDTLHTLKTLPEYHEAIFHLIIGADSLRDFHKWRAPEMIMQLAKLVVYPRAEDMAGFAGSPLVKSYHLLSGCVIGISSTDIRHKIKNNISIRYLVPDAVQQYIEAQGLYK
ncbi:nicotinate (nicotinamide) nucleotide adenylyltransferase [candidate division KSB1 bacterium]|nr:MAG: nicotinate (nicotinamide) nucleotide adenylyltransferase [candidate division KSB1 bacterium]MBC6948540.1 nicotinate (nicotinamide) nucleotide adenylyltransferase [candidate division KSB1 bacterium]MCE7945266.1 nicotinate (nicotinamide) nucleotide adenylyltransferase [Chlorobi bacterium CHB1]MDL1875696.1 nicotinate (nicotinamide) nucleotide adenylyltransferase [Cytophagia bacterium CHB2]